MTVLGSVADALIDGPNRPIDFGRHPIGEPVLDA